MANTLDTIAPPLLDRREVTQLSGYTYDEKLHIVRRFLPLKQHLHNGLSEAHVQVTEHALVRTIGGVVRFKAVDCAALVDA
jgi:ATP-dependent Lon protease